MNGLITEDEPSSMISPSRGLSPLCFRSVSFRHEEYQEYMRAADELSEMLKWKINSCSIELRWPMDDELNDERLYRGK